MYAYNIEFNLILDKIKINLVKYLNISLFLARYQSNPIDYVSTTILQSFAKVLTYTT